MSLSPASPIALSFGRRLQMIADQRGDNAAIDMDCKDGTRLTRSWRDLSLRTNQIARLLASTGTREGSNVVVAFPNSIEHYEVSIAAWKLGACVIPLNHAAPPRERDRLLDLAHPSAVAGDWEDPPPYSVVGRDELSHVDDFSAAELPDRVPNPGAGTATGGSTGSPKIVLVPKPWSRVPGQNNPLQDFVGFRPDQNQLVAGPLYHNAPFSWSYWGLFEGHRLTVMERFDAARAASLMADERINWVFMVPTMLIRIARLPWIRRIDFTNLKAIYHAGAPCPEWVKRFWIELVGPSRIKEAFGPSEDFSTTAISGEEWLAHPGSVGRPVWSEIKILDESGNSVPRGTVGEIFGRALSSTDANFSYLGAPLPKSTPGGLFSVGDMGWLDKDGYLHIADRAMDMIVRGGANVYPAEVEGALLEHPGIFDAVVIGLPDPELGKRVHAIVVVDRGRAVAEADLDLHMRARLARYKVPSSYEFVASLPRDDAGKIARTQLAAERAK